MPKSRVLLTCLATFLGSVGFCSAQAPLVLIRDGRPDCTIVRGETDDFAAERLARWFAEEGRAPVAVIAAEKDPVPERGVLILVGSSKSNPVLRGVAAGAQLDIAPGPLTAQGYVARTLQYDGRDWLILAGGGRDGAIHAVADLVNWRLQRQGHSVCVPQLDQRQIPRYRYRWFWNWDHRMEWGGPGRVGNVMGGGGTYRKQPEAFLIDFKNCIDYMADHKFNGLIIWGFLRDTHGGVEASQELCRYAEHRGVRILPGVGTSGYAGYYFEGDHPYNADAWVAAHPELRAVDKNGRPHNAPCPSKKANQDWLDEGARWLFRTFPIGGVNLEMGDFFVCYCDDCRKARAAIPSDEPDYYKDMAISHMVTLKTMRGLAPEAWLSYATYTGYTAQMMTAPPKFLSLIPEDALCQWTLTGMARRWPADVRPLARHNIGYLHWCNSSTHTPDDFYLESVRDICRDAAAAGFEGLDTYGELSAQRPNAELFYLAWEAFLWNPEMTIEEFADQRLARLYGGAEPAGKLLEILPLVRTAKDRENVENMVQARWLAESARQASAPAGHARWDRMIAYLDRHEQAERLKQEEFRRREAEARRGRKIEIAKVTASDEDPSRGWSAANAVDGNVQEPQGYWLTQRTAPKQAWLELTLAEPTKIDRVTLFHQLNPGHYRTLDYTVSVRTDGAWKPVVAVKDNQDPGWVVHAFEPVVTNAVRLEITRSAYNDRMGVGEIELRTVGPGP
ncbi:MAG: discoidin domain-containing protein [Candidatus Anammoximicrobium sp.]|nr:discoidin domain-containing protein [Candidatus Anammoximicrobium sp.]